MGWEEVPRSLADRNPIDPDDPQAGRHNLMTAIQALSQQLPALRMMTLEKERRLPENARWAPGVGPDLKGQDRVYTLPDLVSDAAGFLPSSVDPIEVMAEIGPLDELLGAVIPMAKQMDIPGLMKGRPNPYSTQTMDQSKIGYERSKQTYGPDIESLDRRSRVAGERLDDSRARTERAELQQMDPSDPWYHGGLRRIEGEYFDPSRGGEAYYGRGVYLTDNPYDAGGYADIRHGDNQAKMDALADTVSNDYLDSPDMIYADWDENVLMEVLADAGYDQDIVYDAFADGRLPDLFTSSQPQAGADVANNALDRLTKKKMSEQLGFGEEHAHVMKLLARKDLKILDHDNTQFVRGQRGMDLEENSGSLDTFFQALRETSKEYEIPDDVFMDIMDTLEIHADRFDLLTPRQVIMKMNERDVFQYIYDTPLNLELDVEDQLGIGDFLQDVYRKMGYQAVRMDANEAFPGTGLIPAARPGSNHLVVFKDVVDDLSQAAPVKSAFAAFDPAKTRERDLMAGLGGAGVGLHALTEEQRKAQSESQ